MLVQKLLCSVWPGWRRAMIVAAVVISPTAIRAQNCVAAPRFTGQQSPMERARILFATAVSAPGLQESVGCSEDSSAVLRYSRRVWLFPASVALHEPSIRLSSLGGLPDARGAGPMWSGRGTSVLGSVGISLDIGWAHALFAPGLWWSENRRFDFLPGTDSARSPFASPFYSGPHSIDLPLRAGAAPLKVFELGESAAWISAFHMDVGVATGTQSLGPGLRNHLMLGPDAPGILRGFARYRAPAGAKVGLLTLAGFAGVLVESRFFDYDDANDARYLLTWNATWARSDSAPVSVGFAHAVLLPTSDYVASRTGAEQMMTVFAQLRSRSDETRAWIEVGRMKGLPSLRDFLTTPSRGLAYVMGFERAQPVGAARLLVSMELANAEQVGLVSGTPTQDFYTSSSVPQGWTHRGRPLGMATGPGSQSQWLAFDWVQGGWSAGLFGERVRWNEDALLRAYLAVPNRHDVSLRWGLRAAKHIGRYVAVAELSRGTRLNYLFQNGAYIPAFRTVDISIPQLRLSLLPPSR